MFTFKGEYQEYSIVVYFDGYITEVFNTSTCNLSQVNWYPDGNSWDMITITNLETNKEVSFKNVDSCDIETLTVEI